MPDRESKPQIDKFREAARELETDQSEERFDGLVRDIAKRSKPPADPKRKD